MTPPSWEVTEWTLPNDLVWRLPISPSRRPCARRTCVRRRGKAASKSWGLSLARRQAHASFDFELRPYPGERHAARPQRVRDDSADKLCVAFGMRASGFKRQSVPSVASPMMFLL